jgi:ribosomal protein L14
VVILLNKNFKPYGTRFFGPVVKELRKQKRVRVSSLGSNHF